MLNWPMERVDKLKKARTFIIIMECVALRSEGECIMLTTVKGASDSPKQLILVDIMQ